MKKQRSKYYILLLLASMFAAPGISAYLFYQHPDWLGATLTNKGTLLKQPFVLKALDKEPKWRIVFWSPGNCEKDCLKEMDLLGRVRLALGRKLYSVDQWLILGADAAPLSAETLALLKEQDFHVAQITTDQINQDMSAQAQVYLANPQNYLILSYELGLNPEDIFKDLKLLLNTTETKSG